MYDPESTHRKPRRRLSVPIFLTSGIWLMWRGLYFALLRPSLLPEDSRYIGTSVAQIQSALPGLERWLSHVFIVMGGFMFASGLLTTSLAATAISARRKSTGIVLLLAGLATVVTMSGTNFAINSTFKWLLLAPAVLWCAGIAAYALERRA
jgi:cytochrome bd-type quinol oxidase subunit 2